MGPPIDKEIVNYLSGIVRGMLDNAFVIEKEDFLVNNAYQRVIEHRPPSKKGKEFLKK